MDRAIRARSSRSVTTIPPSPVVMGWVERRGGQMPERPGQAVTVARAEGVAVVLDEPQVVGLDELHDRIEVERYAQRVRQHDRPGPRRDGRPELLRVGVVVADPDVDE